MAGAASGNDGYDSDTGAPKLSSAASGKSLKPSSELPGHIDRDVDSTVGYYRKACLAVGSPAASWAVPLSAFVDEKRLKLGKQLRKIKLVSVCTGLNSEGMVAEAHFCSDAHF